MTDERRPIPFSRPQVEVFAGTAGFHRCFCDLLDSAQREILDYVIPEQEPDEYDREILSAYARALRRRIRCRTLISADHLALVQRNWDPSFELRGFLAHFPHIRLVDRVRGPFTIADRERVLLNVESTDEPGHYGLSVLLHDRALAALLAEQFERLWSAAEPQQEHLIAEFERRERVLS